MNDKPAAYVDPISGLHVYRASALGYCDTALMLALHGVEGMPPPAKMQAVFDAGHRNEPVMLEKLCAANPKMHMMDTDLQAGVELRIANAVVRGHIDGIIQHGAYQYVVEAKALGDQLYKEWDVVDDTETRWPVGGLWDKYALQASVYMHATKLPLCFVCGHKDAEGVVQEIKYRWYSVAPVTYATVAARVLFLERKALEGMPQGDCAVGDYPCAYYQFHAEKGVDDDVVVLEDSKLADLIREVQAKRDYAQTATKAAELAGKALKAYLEGIGRTGDGAMTQVGGVVVKWNHQEIAGGTFERKAYVKSYPTFTKAPAQRRLV